MNLITTTTDIATTLGTGKSLSEHAVSGVTKLDCQWSRAFSDWKVCLTHEEYLNNLSINGIVIGMIFGFLNCCNLYP